MAANPERGEVDLVCGEKTYTLFLSTNALCIMEKRTGKTFGQILNGIARLDVTATREYLRAVLATHHGQELADMAKARKVDVDLVIGDLTDQAGRKAVTTALMELFALNTPPDEETATKNGQGTADPQSAQDGTGGSST